MPDRPQLPRSILAAAAELEAGRTSSRDLVEACLARIADEGGQGRHCFIEVYHERARQSADAADRLRAAGRAPGPLCGIPISIKDLFDVAGEVTRAGSTVLAGAPRASSHAEIVKRLLGAGIVFVGRTNMTEFAFSGVGMNPHYGTPLSPWDRANGRIPGGSSSGAAVSVSDGFAIGAIGTDTGGSCRIPAALCGVTGFKPTARRVPLDGALPLSPTLDSIGPLGHSVSCCAILDSVLAGTSGPVAPVTEVRGARLLLPTNIAFDNIDASTEEAFDFAISTLEKSGYIVDRCQSLAIDAVKTAQTYGGFAAAEAFSWHKELLAAHGDKYDPHVSARINSGSGMTASDYFRLMEARKTAIAIFEAELQGYSAMVLPTVPIAPPLISAFNSDDEYKRLNFLLLRNPSTINFLDGCALSLPCHRRGASPAGVMLAAPAMQDAQLLRLAAGVEAELATRM